MKDKRQNSKVRTVSDKELKKYLDYFNKKYGKALAALAKR